MDTVRIMLCWYLVVNIHSCVYTTAVLVTLRVPFGCVTTLKVGFQKAFLFKSARKSDSTFKEK